MTTHDQRAADQQSVDSDQEDAAAPSPTSAVAQNHGATAATETIAPQDADPADAHDDSEQPVPAATEPHDESEQPVPAASEAAVVVTETTGTTSLELSAPPTTNDSATEDPSLTAPEAGAATVETIDSKMDAGARIREKLTARTDDQAVGSSDGGTPRQERSEGRSPVEIPSDAELAAELDVSLEAQISAALETDISSPVDAAPVVGLEAEQGDETPLLEELGPGSLLKGTVQQIHGENVFIEAGVRSGVVVPLRQFAQDKQPSIGDEVTVIIDAVDGDGLFTARLPQGRHKVGGNWDALAVGQVVDCMVTATNKGGLQVTVSGLKGFMPASQVDLGYVADLEIYVGQKLTAQVTEVNKKKRNLVLSRRTLLQVERASQQGDFWASLEVGQDREGTVKTIKDYGAFVDLGAMDGFLHIGEMAWSRINHPKEVVSEGQAIQVRILRLDADRQRISLGMKQLIQNPWLSAVERYAPERIVAGKVTRVADFGAFVELEPGIEGLAHISELAWRRIGKVSEVLSVGECRDFQVIEVDPKRKRISLSVKALEKQPEQAAPKDHEPPAVRKTNPNLRGGTSKGQAGSGLFGNPSDFT